MDCGDSSDSNSSMVVISDLGSSSSDDFEIFESAESEVSLGEVIFADGGTLL